MKKALFTLSDMKKLRLDSAAIHNMFSFAQDMPCSPESGGILVGRVFEDNSSSIDSVSIPTQSDIRSRYRFYRKPTGHQEFFNANWTESDGHCFYLGEWHTHPEAVPSPSSVDLRGWRKILRSSLQGQPYLFFIIVGTTCLEIWRGRNHRGKVLIDYVGGIERNVQEQ